MNVGRAAATANCELLSWDTEHFGVRIGRVRDARPDADALDRALEWAASEHVSCLFLLVDATGSDPLRLAASRGFRFVDLRLTLRRKLEDLPIDPLVPFGVTVRHAHAGDEAALVSLAAVNHTDSRFYADGRFERGSVDRLFARWMHRSLRGVLADLVLVVEAEGRLAGYVTTNLDEEGDAGIIGLLGVASWARSAGFGQLLISTAMEELRQRGARSVAVTTQGRNAAAQRAYQARGFRTHRADTWLHWWADEVLGSDVG